VTNRFPLPTLLKQLENVPQEEFYEILPHTVELVEAHSKKDCGCIEGKMWPKHHINKEICTISVLKNAIFWDVMPYGSCKKKRFGGMYRLYHQSEKNR
jgi:hypothetical protein